MSGNTDDASVTLESACGHLFDSTYTGPCWNPPRPASELARIRPRFEQWCLGQYALPGVVSSAQRVDSCATPMAAAACNASLPDICQSQPGTLPNGAACNLASRAQGTLPGWSPCQSGDCLTPHTSSVDGSVAAPPTCGTCAAEVPVGQACELSGPLCADGSFCLLSPGQAQKTCAFRSLGDAGAACDGTAFHPCAAGLYCNERADGAAGTCSIPLVEGSPCAQPEECASLVCEMGTCQNPGGLGASCSGGICAAGLACSAGACSTITWVGPGQPCGTTANCLVGECSASTGSCPTIVSDGQPCEALDQATTCDEFASCLNGICSLAATGCP
jgi:hypothetical protein